MIKIPTSLIQQSIVIRYDRQKNLVQYLAYYDAGNWREFARNNLRGFLIELGVTKKDCESAFHWMGADKVWKED